MKTRYFVLTVGDMPDIAEFEYIDIMDIRKRGKNKKTRWDLWTSKF
jgi:hypothetical protein